MIRALLVFGASAQAPASPPASTPVAVSVELAPVQAALMEGRPAHVTISMVNPGTGLPLDGLYPAAWIDRVGPCQEQLIRFLHSGTSAKAEVDLNVYLVAALNDDATITVVDPLFGYGGSRLLTQVNLPGVGEDWVESGDGKNIFVTVPAANVVVVVDTTSWMVAASIPVATRPTRIRLQPDGGYLWVTHDDPAGGHLTAIRTADLSVAASIELPGGAHDIAISDDSRRVYVTSSQADEVTLVDVASLSKRASLHTGDEPVSIAWTGLAGAALVAHAGDGALVMIGGDPLVVRSRAKVEPGLGQVRFTPDGRLAFALNPVTNLLHIVDAANGRVVQSGPMESGPEQVMFSSDLAFIRHLRSDEILMVPWRQMGLPGAPIQAVDFTGGTHVPADGRVPSVADAIIAAPDAAAVLVANPADGTIYYYMEGMAAPMGSFENYGHEPRALLVVDRGLHEVEPGRYAAVAELPAAGEWQVHVFVDSPRVVECRPITVAPDPSRVAPKATLGFSLVSPAQHVGRRLEVTMLLLDPDTGEPLSDVPDLAIRLIQAPGLWHRMEPTKRRRNGRYTARFDLPESGVYQVFISCPSRGLSASIQAGVIHARVPTRRSPG